MKKYIICTAILALFISYGSSAQKKWDLGVTLAPNYTKAVPAHSNPHSFNNNADLGGGITAFKKLSNKFYFQTGANIVKQRYTESNISVSTYTEKAHIVFRFTNLDIPVYLNFRLPVSKKLSITSSAGVAFSWTIKSEGIMYTPVGISSVFKSKKRPDFRNLRNFYASFGLGALYHLNDKFSVIAMPGIMRNGFGSQFFVTSAFDLRLTLLYRLSNINKKVEQ